MATLQVKCPDTGKPVDVGDASPNANIALSLWSRPIACPHCGGEHAWSSGHLALAMNVLRDSPDATRIVVEGDTATALP